MPFSTHFLSVSVIPHVFSRMDSTTKNVYKRKYRKIKLSANSASLVSIGAIEARQLVKDVISSKLKAYGYKSLLALTIGPIIQVVSLPAYIFSYGSVFQKYASSLSYIGAEITRGEMNIANWAWFGLDVILFGEAIPITDNMTLMILSNETISTLKDLTGE